MPQKYWAVAIPIYLSVAFFLFVFIVYPSLGMIITPHLHDVRNITDEKSIYSGKFFFAKNTYVVMFILGAIQIIRDTFWPILDPLPLVSFGDIALYPHPRV